MTRHRFDALSFLAGTVFVAIGIAALVEPLRWPAGASDVLLPTAAVVVGLGILLTLRPGRSSDDDAEPGSPSDPHDVSV
jgi:hypothetical protein